MEYVETGVLQEADQEGDARPELNVVCQLVVNNVMSDDCGEVECRAFNSGGMDSTRAQLFMRCTSLTVLLITSCSESIRSSCVAVRYVSPVEMLFCMKFCYVVITDIDRLTLRIRARFRPTGP